MRTVSVDRLTAAYDTGDPVLRDVTVSAEPGRMLAVSGRSGAGKTTLLTTMAGLLRPASGTVFLDGEPLRDRDHAVAQGVALIPQDNGLATFLTAGENVEVALLANGCRPAEARRLTVEFLEQLGLAGQRDQLVEELSGGQQQRTAIARGLALRGDVLLADEVTSELDAVSRQSVMELLRKEADRGAAVVFATHDPDAAALCDAELHLVDGSAELIRAELDPPQPKGVEQATVSAVPNGGRHDPAPPA
ncbi:ATP-binding cassette domain-containing protein [Actinopolymorpha pittospori]|uniref:ABC transport system ATP-binding protein n=1 Tax=Actinopolymorpha pittospori TaxID=648752 RepID=A0A927MY51_9ACTN|nr:ATP-binding cassette domain-containing protein [Actinopolymorpha pittospori]MBE1608362.1 putative ABC transport system ATP-binding protein [Actinopolymorpha pittospori]